MSKRDDILNSVITEFKINGITDNLTISKIAQATDIGKSTVYEYFSSKDSLIKEAIFKIIDEYIEKMLDIKNIETLSFKESFIELILKIVAIAKDSKSSYEIYTREFIHKLSDNIYDDLKTKLEDVQKVFAERFIVVFSKGIEEKLIVMKEDELDILMSAGLIMGSTIRYNDFPNNITAVDFANKLYETIVILNSDTHK